MSGGFNLNNYVWVKVTDFGWETYDAHWLPFAKYLKGRHARDKSVNGWNKFPLWDLMGTFGSAHSLGIRPCFEGNDIYFEEPSDAS